MRMASGAVPSAARSAVVRLVASDGIVGWIVQARRATRAQATRESTAHGGPDAAPRIARNADAGKTAAEGLTQSTA